MKSVHVAITSSYRGGGVVDHLVARIGERIGGGPGPAGDAGIRGPARRLVEEGDANGRPVRRRRTRWRGH